MEKLAIVTIRDITERKTRRTSCVKRIKKLPTKKKPCAGHSRNSAPPMRHSKPRKTSLCSRKNWPLSVIWSPGWRYEINNPVGFISSNMEILEQYIADYAKVLKMADHLQGKC